MSSPQQCCGQVMQNYWKFCPMCAKSLDGSGGGGGGGSNRNFEISRCKRCSGGGRIAFIKGNGKRGGACEGCGGTGYVAVEKGAGNCRECKGAGTINQIMGGEEVCEVCRGHGFDYKKVLRKPKFEQNDLAEVTCRLCNGSGRFNKADCQACMRARKVQVFRDKLPCGFCANKGLLSNNNVCHICKGCGFAFAVLG